MSGEAWKDALFGQAAQTITDEEHYQVESADVTLSPIDVYMPRSEFVDKYEQIFDGKVPGADSAPTFIQAPDVVLDKLEYPWDDLEAVELEAWSNQGGELLLSKIPCEAMFHLLQKVTGVVRWWDLELPAILEKLTEEDLVINSSGIGKIQGLQVLCANPDKRSLFHKYESAFHYLGSHLVGFPGFWERRQVMTPFEMCAAIYISLDIRPEPFSDEVLASMAAACLHYGLWCLPDVLSVAQEAIYPMADYHGYEVTPNDVERVQDIVIELLQEPDSFPDEPKGTDQMQAYFTAAVIRSAREDFMRGQAAKFAVLRKINA